MSSRATLNSRLRVLVARAFRAEKLYGSSAPNRPDKRLSYAQLAEAAGELRAREWQKCYYQLRTALNDVLSTGSAQGAVDGVIILRRQFQARMEEAAQFVEQASGELQEAAGRQEFSHLFKLTLELIRQKAVAQSCRAVCDELGAVLKASGISPGDRERRRGVEPSWLTAAPDAPQEDADSLVASIGKANVVPLRRHSAFGKSKR